MAILSRAPERFVQGETVQWIVDPGDDARPADGATLTYRFSDGTTAKTAAGTNYGDGTFLVTISATDSAAYTAGDWTYSAITTKAGVVVQVDRGTVTVEPSLAAAADGRSFAKRMLDLVEAAIEAKASDRPDVSSYTFKDRSLAAWSWEQLHAERNRWRSEYRSELDALRVSKGLGSKGKIRCRFF